MVFFKLWLDTENNVINEPISPISPANYLGGLTAIKYDGTSWVEADETNTDNSWYNYIAQTGVNDRKKYVYKTTQMQCKVTGNIYGIYDMNGTSW